jgi:hypothetical protein
MFDVHEKVSLNDYCLSFSAVMLCFKSLFQLNAPVSVVNLLGNRFLHRHRLQ